MGVYFIANIRMKDEETYNRYIADSSKVFKQYNGKYLAVDNNPEVLEGSWDYTRLVLIAFPDRESLDAWYHSEAYQDILKYRLAGADCDTLVVSSLD